MICFPWLNLIKFSDHDNGLQCVQLFNIFIDTEYKIIKNLLMNFSLEIGPKTDLSTLPKVKDVYVTMLPGGD